MVFGGGVAVGGIVDSRVLLFVVVCLWIFCSFFLPPSFYLPSFFLLLLPSSSCVQQHGALLHAGVESSENSKSDGVAGRTMGGGHGRGVLLPGLYVGTECGRAEKSEFGQ